MNTSSLSKRFKYTDPKSYDEFITGLKLDLKDVQMKAKTVEDTNDIHTSDDEVSSSITDAIHHSTMHNQMLLPKHKDIDVNT